MITIAQRKGGAGKTTLAAQLAIAWAKGGARIALLDIDPQGSLAAWVRLRRARLGDAAIGFEFAALPGWRAEQWIGDHARDAGFVIVDSPPHAETEARIAVRVAGLVLIPVQPSPLDLWATEATSPNNAAGLVCTATLCDPVHCGIAAQCVAVLRPSATHIAVQRYTAA
ncbi:MAG TPA: ParA family protein [Stellaceae bacterium]